MPKRSPIAGTELDPTITFVEVELDGRSYKLAYDFHGIARAEGAINGLRGPGEEPVNLVHGLAGLMTAAIDYKQPPLLFADARQVLGLFYGALLLAQPKMTLRDAARLLLPERLAIISPALIQAYIEYMPEVRKLRQDPTSAAGGGGAASAKSSTDLQPGENWNPSPACTSA